MKIITLILFILVSCKTSLPPQQIGDEFDKIFILKKSNNPQELVSTLGEPGRIDKSDPATIQFYFAPKKDQLPIKAFVSKKTNKITTIALTYWVDFDAYASLKKRFKSYKWIETPV